MTKPFKWNVPSENEVEDAIIKFLNFQIGCFAYKVQTKASFDPAIGYYRKLPKNVEAGTHDVQCCLDLRGVPIFIGFEVKKIDGRQSGDQKTFQEKLERKGNGFYFIVRSIKETEEALRKVKETILPKLLPLTSD